MKLDDIEQQTAGSTGEKSDIFEEIRALAKTGESKYIRIESGKSIILEFSKDKIKVIPSRFDEKNKRIEFGVITPEGEEKILELARSWALDIIDLMQHENARRIKVSRRGSGLSDTKYTFMPA